jgi:putative ABC transport system permease protein
MWRISRRDLQYRSRRFLIAIAVTALVFGIAVAIDGVKQTLQNEPADLVSSFHADSWLVRRGSSGLFTTTAVLPEFVAARIRGTPGVRSAEPIVTGRSTIATGKRQNVNLIGFDLRRGGPKVVEGRAATGAGEVVVGAGAGVGVGDRLKTTNGSFRVVGRANGSRYNAGAPTLFLTVKEAQRVSVDGQPLVMGVAIRGQPRTLPVGTSLATNENAVADLRLTIKSATATIDFVALLTWLIAAGVIGAIVYLTAIERSRDFAVLRAIGSPDRLIVGGLMIQALLVSLVAAVLSVPLALVLKLGMPLPVTLSGTSAVRIVVVGIVVGVLASLAAVRRALKTDPALAFGGL